MSSIRVLQYFVMGLAVVFLRGPSCAVYYCFAALTSNPALPLDWTL